MVFRGISFFITPPMVSKPKDRGVTSSNKISLISPPKMPAWIAAPTATTSSGLTFWLGSRSINVRTKSCTRGIRVEPPTRITSSMRLGFNPASLSARFRGRRRRLTKSPHISSNSALVNLVSICLGPSSVAVIKGRLISVTPTPDSSILAFSATSPNRCNACRSFRRSIPSFSAKNFSASQSTILLSKSVPPNWVSPLVALTSNTPSPISRIDTSKVPPPRSNTSIVWLWRRSRP